MKNYNFILPAANKNVFIPANGALKEVAITAIELSDDTVSYFDDKGDLIFADNVGNPTFEAYYSFEDYKSGNTISNTVSITDIFYALRFLIIKSDKLYYKGWKMDGEVVVKVDQPADLIRAEVDECSWKIKHDGLYESKEDAMWENDTVEVKADGTAVRHDAEKKTWALTDTQQEIVETIKTALQKAKENKLLLYFYDGVLGCVNYDKFVSGEMLYSGDCGDNDITVPDKATTVIDGSTISSMYEGDVIVVKK